MSRQVLLKSPFTGPVERTLEPSSERPLVFFAHFADFMRALPLFFRLD
jgi:hypothetical protein